MIPITPSVVVYCCA